MASVLGVLASGCGSDSAQVGEGPGVTAGTSPSGDTTQTTLGASSETGVGTSAADETSDVPGESPVRFDVGTVTDLPLGDGFACSGDLQQVISRTGVVIETCPPEQGCLAGECVAACAAAAGARGSTGCEFIVPTSPFYANGSPVSQSGPCHALLVSNPWGRPAVMELGRGGEDYDIEVVTRIPSGIGQAATYAELPPDGLPSGQVAVIFLAHRPGVSNGSSLECPFSPAVLEDTAAIGTGSGVAFEFVSDTPIQVYDIIPYGGAASYLPSASLIFPSTAWGESYLAIAPHAETGPEWMMAVAREDGTTVSINPTVPITTGAIENPPVGMATQYELDAGEIVQWQSSGDPVGSIITADAPIGVFTGNAYLLVTTADGPSSGQDSAHQMIPDVNALGSEYVGAGLYSRLAGLAAESVRYRVVGVVDGTALDWDPIPPVGAPEMLDAGQAVEFETRDFFRVRSQGEDNPFALTQYMSGTLSGQPGCGNSPGLCGLGDEEWVMLVPPAQFLQSYAFFVDPTYGTSTLVVTRTRTGGGFADVELECLGTIENWLPVGNDGLYEVAHVELFRSGVGMSPACETSQHVAASSGDFGIVVWGTDEFASYGYPAGGGLESINAIVLDPEG